MQDNMLLPLLYMQICPLCYLDLPPVGMVIALVWVGLKVTVTVVVVTVMVVDYVAGMDMQNFVAEMAWMKDIVGMKMAVGTVAGIAVDIVETVVVVGFHNYIPFNLVQVVVDIVVEAKLAMALEGPKDYKMDKHNFAEGLVADSVVAF